MAAAAKTVSPHIAFDERGSPYVAGTRVKIYVLAGYHRYQSLTAEQLAESFPDLSKAQIYAALLFYYENQAEIDAELNHIEGEAEKALAAQDSTSWGKRLRQLLEGEAGRA